MRRVGVTTSGAVNSSGPPSTENCRSSQKLTSGRRTVDETRRKRSTRSVAVTVVRSPTAVLRRHRWQTWCHRRGRREDAPVAVSCSTTPSLLNVVPPSVDVARPHRRRSRVDDRANPGSTANDSAPAAAVVCCCRACCHVCMCSVVFLSF